MKVKLGRTQAYLTGCGVSAVPPDHVGLDLHYAKSLQELTAVRTGRRQPRELRLIVTKDAAESIRDSISSGILVLEGLRKL